jgi:hypothetical protein
MSELFARLEERLRESDVPQVATLVFAALVVALVTAWPSPGSSANESWFAFAQTRSVILALLALGYGASASAEAPRRAVSTGLLTVLLAVLVLPLEVAAYAGSYPATPLWWSLVSVPIAALGYLVLGVLLGRVVRAVRLGAFLPLVVPAVVIGLLLLDLRLGWTVLNPVTSATMVSPLYLVMMAALGLTGIAFAATGWRRQRVREEMA